jgi:type IV pilus assembly protein PilV
MNADIRKLASVSPREISGVGLIEVLVAVAILAFGLLGIAALQATALRNSQSSYDRSQAVALSYSILDRMRANLDVARINGYNIPETCDAPAVGDQVANDLHEWITDIHETLHDDKACGTITCGADAGASVRTRICTIAIQWNDSRGTGDEDTLEKMKFVTSTAL